MALITATTPCASLLALKPRWLASIRMDAIAATIRNVVLSAVLITLTSLSAVKNKYRETTKTDASVLMLASAAQEFANRASVSLPAAFQLTTEITIMGAIVVSMLSAIRKIVIITNASLLSLGGLMSLSLEHSS